MWRDTVGNIECCSEAFTFFHCGEMDTMQARTSTWWKSWWIDSRASKIIVGCSFSFSTWRCSFCTTKGWSVSNCRWNGAWEDPPGNNQTVAALTPVETWTLFVASCWFHSFSFLIVLIYVCFAIINKKYIWWVVKNQEKGNLVGALSNK